MDENPVQSLGFINRLKNRLSQINQRTAFDAFLILFIVVGLIATVFLAGQRQIFRSGASQNGSAEVVGENGQPIQTKDESGNPVVETQQIRIKIEFPTDWTDWNTQSLLPRLINPAYAQVVNGVNLQEHCASSDGFRYENGIKTKNCSGYNPDSLGPGENDTMCKTFDRYKGVNDYFYNSCGFIPVPTSIPVYARVTCENLNGLCARSDGVPKDNLNLKCQDSGYLGFRGDGTNRFLDCDTTSGIYPYCYTSSSCAAAPTPVPTDPPAAAQPTATPAQAQRCGTNWEGKLTQCSADDKLNEAKCTYLDAWSRPRSEVCSTSTPFCWACPESAFGTPPPAGGPTATPVQPTTSQQPPTPTPVPEQTEWIRISLNETNVRSGNCWNETTKTGTGSQDPRQHCMEFSITDPYFTQRGNMADLWLPNQPKTYTIYIGFVSNKGNLKPDLLSIKVNYKPKAPPVAKTTPVQPAGKECTSDVDPNGFARFCVNKENRDRFKNVCSGGELNVGYNCPPNFPYCLIGSDVICSPQSTQPTVQPTPPITTCNQLFEDCMKGDLEGTNKPYCDRIKYQCELPKTGGTPLTPTPTTTPPSAPSPTLSAALPITGKVKITANGTQYDSVEIRYYDDDKRVGRVYLLKGYLPTNQDQEGSYTTEPMMRNQTVVWPIVHLSAGGTKTHSSKVDCPGRQSTSEDSSGCISEKGSTQNLSVTLPTPTPTPLPRKLLRDTPSILKTNTLYIQNAKETKIVLKSIEKREGWLRPAVEMLLTSAPVELVPIPSSGNKGEYYGDVFYLGGSPRSYPQSECYPLIGSLGIIVTYYDYEDSKEKAIEGEYVCGRYGIITIK